MVLNVLKFLKALHRFSLTAFKKSNKYENMENSKMARSARKRDKISHIGLLSV